MSNAKNNSLSCQMTCWIIAALIGLAAAIALMVVADWSFLQGIFIGLLLFVILGLLLGYLLCRPLPGPNESVAPTTPSTGPIRATSAATAASSTAGTTAEQSSAPSDSSAQAHASTSEPAPRAPSAQSEAAGEAAVSAGGTTNNGTGLKPSVPLPGQEELAARKGTWRYEPEAGDKANSGSIADYDGDGVLEGENEGKRPEALEGPRDGGADDLKRIKGIGPKLEKLCNSLGFYHFDQVAAWTSDEVAWVDANLEGFRGRVSRDEWVKQAKLLASGEETEFSKRVDDGDVY